MEKDKNIKDKNIGNIKANDNFFFIGIIGLMIWFVLMMVVTLIPNISHATEVDIILYGSVFGSVGLFILLISF